MRAICYVQEVKNSDLTMRQQILICRKALRKLRWPCVLELFAQGRHRRTTAYAASRCNGLASRCCKR